MKMKPMVTSKATAEMKGAKIARTPKARLMVPRVNNHFQCVWKPLILSAIVQPPIAGAEIDAMGFEHSRTSARHMPG